MREFSDRTPLHRAPSPCANVLRLPIQHRLTSDAFLNTGIVVQQSGRDFAVVEKLVEELALPVGPLEQGIERRLDRMGDPVTQVIRGPTTSLQVAAEQWLQVLFDGPIRRQDFRALKVPRVRTAAGHEADERGSELRPLQEIGHEGEQVRRVKRITSDGALHERRELPRCQFLYGECGDLKAGLRRKPDAVSHAAP